MVVALLAALPWLAGDEAGTINYSGTLAVTSPAWGVGGCGSAELLTAHRWEAGCRRAHKARAVSSIASRCLPFVGLLFGNLFGRAEMLYT